MSEVKIDPDLMRAGSDLSQTQEKLVEMTSGCICCTLRDDLLIEVRRLWPTAQSARDILAAQWATPFGDRRQELVFIGAGMDRAAIAAALDACLFGPADRFAPGLASHLADPFPIWRRQEQAA